MKIVFMHGLGQTSNSWNAVLSNLNVSEIKCLNMMDLINFESDKATYHDLYSSFCDELNKKNEDLSLCGLSLGGVLALNYAIDYPKKVNSLVLIAPQFRMPKTILRLQNLVFRVMPKSMFKKIGLKKEAVIMLCESMVELDFTYSIGNIKCPTLIVYGSKDTVNRKSAIALNNKIQNSKLEVIDGVGHEVNIEAPEKLAKIIEEFFFELN